jgi:hypothetical protein
MRWCKVATLILAGAQAVAAEESSIGVAAPVTVTGGAVLTGRLRATAPEYENPTGDFAAAFRTMLYPTIKLGSRWFAYGAIQVHSEPFAYYYLYYPEFEVEAEVLQAYVGYRRTGEKGALVVKAGRLTSAFGSFPLRYDDAANPLLDMPLPYGSYVPIRPDQLPCRVSDFTGARNHPTYAAFYCSDPPREHWGMTPVTVYGLPGAEIDVSHGRVDARFQFTTSSPANPRGFLSNDRQPQWTAGGGFTIRQGLRVGASAYRGPFLDALVAGSLPRGTTVRDFPATGIGVDVQWARGRWSTGGEWQRFSFPYPGFRVSPVVSYGYGEAKATLLPRLYVAGRAGYRSHNRIADARKYSDGGFLPTVHTYDAALGYWVNPRQLVKVGYQWVHTAGGSPHRDNVLGVQFVTSVHSLSKALR